MKNIFKSFFKKPEQNESAKEFNIMEVKEGYTVTEVMAVISEWENTIRSEQPIRKILIVNNKLFGSCKKGNIIDVQEYSSPNVSGYKGVTAGGVFTIPTLDNIQDVFEGNILYVPYFD